MLQLPKAHPSVNEALSQINDWQPVARFCELCPDIPEQTIKWQLTQRHTNGLAPYVRVIGKQRFISITGYAQWLNKP